MRGAEYAIKTFANSSTLLLVYDKSLTKPDVNKL